MSLTKSANGQQSVAMMELIERLYPIHRCVTGAGVRETLRILGEFLPLTVTEVPSGTRVLDWTIPQEWNIRDAYVRDATGVKVIDYQKSNLHVVGYSRPVRDRLSWSELKQRLTTLPAHPDWVPYRVDTQTDWGFCLSQRQFEALESRGEAEYEVVIDSTLSDGALTYAECYLPGQTEDEVLFSVHVCHPSLANDNLSGIAIAVQLALSLSATQNRYSYRFVFAPATIGAIAWLSRQSARAARVKHGLVLALLGDSGPSTYKKSRRGDAEIDRAVEHVLRESAASFQVREFVPWGYDERQYCSPGFDLPVGCLMRTPNGEYPEYHTSADDLSLIDEASLADSLAKCQAIVSVLEHNQCFVNRNPYGEPALGSHGLYRPYGDARRNEAFQQAVLWILNLSDGAHSLLAISQRSAIAFEQICEAARVLCEHELLAPVGGHGVPDRPLAVTGST